MVNETLTRAPQAGGGEMIMTETNPESAAATGSVRRHPRGGIYFDDFVAGEMFVHRYYRTVTQMDNMLFSNMTLNPQPLHIDRHFCAQETEWGQPLMNSLFTLGLMIGMSSSRIRCSRTTRCTPPPKWPASAPPSRAQAPVSSN
jgi:hypothetical protein